MATRLLLVRHGQSEWNALGRWQGQADPVLSSLGRQQARMAALSVDGVRAVFSSTLQRASQTAEIIAEELGAGPVTRVAELIERDAGEWSGLTRAEIEERWPGYLESSSDEHTGFGPAARTRIRRPPGWEHDDMLLERALAGLARVSAAAGDGPALVITHGGLIYTVEVHLGAPFARMANLDGRWVSASLDGDGVLTLHLGDRVRLIDPEQVSVTVPTEI